MLAPRRGIDAHAERARRIGDLVKRPHIGDDDADACIFHRNAAFDNQRCGNLEHVFANGEHLGEDEKLGLPGHILQGHHRPALAFFAAQDAKVLQQAGEADFFIVGLAIERGNIGDAEFLEPGGVLG